MKNAYPILITQDGSWYLVSIPDFDIRTQGRDIPDAICMARDAIGLMGIDMEDDCKELPPPRSLSELSPCKGEIITLVDVDFSDYRRKNDLRTVKKNCTLPNWLCYEAEKAKINFSQVLQAALKKELNIKD